MTTATTVSWYENVGSLRKTKRTGVVDGYVYDPVDRQALAVVACDDDLVRSVPVKLLHRVEIVAP